MATSSNEEVPPRSPDDDDDSSYSYSYLSASPLSARTPRNNGYLMSGCTNSANNYSPHVVLPSSHLSSTSSLLTTTTTTITILQASPPNNWAIPIVLLNGDELVIDHHEEETIELEQNHGEDSHYLQHHHQQQTKHKRRKSLTNTTTTNTNTTIYLLDNDEEEEYHLYYNDLYEEVDNNDIYDPLIYDGEEYIEVLNQLYDGNSQLLERRQNSASLLRAPASQVDPIPPSPSRNRLRSLSMRISQAFSSPRILQTPRRGSLRLPSIAALTSATSAEDFDVGLDMTDIMSAQSPRTSGRSRSARRRSLTNSIRLFFSKSAPTSPRDGTSPTNNAPFSPTTIANLFMSTYDSESDSTREDAVIPHSESATSESTSSRKKTILDADFQEFKKLKRSRIRAVSPFVQLPREVIMVVISFLNFSDLLNLLVINRPLFKICTHDLFWKDVCEGRGLKRLDNNRPFRDFFITNQIRVMLVGEHTIGKSTLVQALTNNPVYILESYASHQMKQAMPYHACHTLGGNNYYYYFYDPGVPKPADLPDHKLAMMDIVLVCCTTEEEKTLKEAKRWINHMKAYVPERRMILLGLRTDMREDDILTYDEPDVITQEEGEKMARAYGLFTYLETCSLTKTGFRDLATSMTQLKLASTRIQRITDYAEF